MHCITGLFLYGVFVIFDAGRRHAKNIEPAENQVPRHSAPLAKVKCPPSNSLKYYREKYVPVQITSYHILSCMTKSKSREATPYPALPLTIANASVAYLLVGRGRLVKSLTVGVAVPVLEVARAAEEQAVADAALPE
ncbi:hypothetical protein B0H67DRAFT_590550 [Lasiosphaeris hirsuta]|uniref:Uncharacterized protein n=1 Tax=Lasiosphaeris hirsuta TaxID=260670 RepID=A0AA40A3E9_9PEZI|nr:hypothetical protein B0H67DRAFT_590550 [Lasiosphaeris hirsuta]